MKLRAVIGSALLTSSLLVGCAVPDDDTCDEYEATSYGEDCGYWVADDTGATVWVWYVWVTPYVGGTPKNGQKPTVPAGTKTVPPPKVKPPLPAGVKPPAPKPPAPKPPAPKPPPPKGR